MRVEGSLTRDQVVSVIGANARQMRLCYETALRSNDTLSSTVVVTRLGSRSAVCTLSPPMKRMR